MTIQVRNATTGEKKVTWQVRNMLLHLHRLQGESFSPRELLLERFIFGTSLLDSQSLHITHRASMM